MQADSSGCTAMDIAEASNVQGRNDELLMLLKSHTTVTDLIRPVSELM